MRIVLDLQGAQGEGRHRGIGRYTLSLAQAIVREHGEHEVVLALSDLYPDTVEPIRGFFDGQLPQELIRVWKAPGPVGSQNPANDWRRVAAQRIREAFLETLEPDVVHTSDPFGGLVEDVVTGSGALRAPFLTTVSLYDLGGLLDRDAHFVPGPRHERHHLDAVAHLRRADGWLAVSESTAREARNHLQLDAEFLVTVAAACDPNFRSVAVSRESEGQLRARYGLPCPFVMHSGGSDPTKNLNRLIQAFAGLPAGLRRAHQLALVGNMAPAHVDALQATARAAGLGTDDVRITGDVGDSDLVLLYNLCELFVLPSLHEGFALSALEAMACGAAVIGGRLSSLPEVIGWAEAMFDPLDVASMRAKIERALTDVPFRSELISRGAQQSQRFSWDQSAKHAVAAFEWFHASRTRMGVRRAGRPDQVISRLVRELRAVPGSPDDRDFVGAAKAIVLNHPATVQRRLLVDVSELVRIDVGSGIQRVVRSMLTWLPSELPASYQMEPVYATSDRLGYRHARCSDSRAGGSRVASTDDVVEPRPGDIFLGLDLQPAVVVAQSDYYAELRRLGIPVYFVVYDLLPVLMPQRFTRDLELLYQRWLQVVCASDGALCISRSVADELRSWVQVASPRRHRPYQVGWFHLGADIEQSDPLRGLPGDATRTLGELAARPTFLLVATIEPRKGHAQALDAFELLWGDQTDAILVFVGSQGWQVEALVARIRQHPELGRRLFWLDGISDEYLDAIYRASTCLIIPSEGEGFGLPLIEAARRGTPIIARDIRVFREIAGEHAFYFDGLDPANLADAVRDWLVLRGQGRHPRPVGIDGLTWQQSAAQLVDFLSGGRRYWELLPTPGSTGGD